MKKQILFTFTILVLAVCLIGAASAEAVDENVPSISENTINDTTNTIAETEKSTPDVTITGEVQKCSDGEPFPGVTVTVTSSEETISTTTTADGTYSLNFKSSLTNFQVTASAPGHQPSIQEVTVLPGDNIYLGTANFKLGMDTVYVATTGSDITGDGTEANPYRTIAKGITEANPDGTVNVADGTYQEHLTIGKNVNLLGTSQTGTIIDGTSNGRPVTIGAGAIVSMSFFTIQNGRATGYDAYGGGIYNSGNLTLNNCTVKNNQANPTGFYGSSYGGGIYNEGYMTIKGSTVEYNTGTGYYAYGGGINNWGTMTIEDSTVEYNNAMSSSDEAQGGGIYNENTLTIINSTIKGNTAWSTYPDDAYGGGIYNYGTLIMDNTNMEGNIARGYYAEGGGIYNHQNGNMEINNSNINKNEAQASGSSCYGGGIYLNGGSLTLTNSNVNENTVTGPSGYSAEGGGIYNSGANMNITGGSVSSNRVNGGDVRGGGISISWGYHNIVAINGCTIQDNALYSTFATNGGGIYYHAGPGYNTATMTITDSTLKGNTATDGGGIYNYQSTITITGSTIQENNAVVGAGIWSSGTTTISDSTITGNIASIQGGGIDHRGGTLTVTDSNITHNTATSYGGGISNDGALNIQNSAINDNTAMFGGGIYNIDREVVLDNTELLRNTASGVDVNGARGGAIFNYNGAVTIDNSIINYNTATALTDSFGGGIYTRGGSLTVTNSNINHNTATAVSNVYGGGIYTYDTTVTMNFNRIVGNSPKAIYHSLDSQYGTVNAEYNWWGSNYDAITSYFGSVDIWPWLYMTFQADPTTIQQGSTSTLTANFNNAWDGENQVTPFDPVIGHLPDGTPVTFTTDLGQVGSQTVDKPTVNGVATATLTGTESGLANLSGILDDETLTGNVEVENNPCANVTITKTGNGPLNVGDTGTFTVSLHNYGPDAAHNVLVSDVEVPAGWTVTPSVGSWDPATKTWSVGTLNNGAGATLTISGLVNAVMAGTTLTNTVTETQDEPNQESQTATASIIVNPLANVTVTKTGNGPLNVGDTGTFTVSLHNYGPDAAHNVLVSDVEVPAGWTVTPSVGSWDPATKTWSVGTLNNGAGATLTISGLITTAMAGTTITNTVTETQDEFTQETQTATASITVNPVTSKADLYINSWSSKNNPAVGEEFIITFKLGNNGPDTAENVVFTLLLPDGVEFVSVEVDQGTANYDPVTRIITWSLDIVEVGDPYARVSVRALDVGSFIFRPTLTTDTDDPNLESNIQTLTVDVQAAGEPTETSSETVNAQTVGMQETGTPILRIVLAILMVLGGFISTLKKQ
ncbi:MAG TPA: DUF11 domain-containing protein [Methanobacterium subterraneum]|uniref:DUF11 domain-containing protein n=1 Tax=Methanobacterium subterraneum TaxID=59277 RepID=A0A7J4TIK1_9EURY|nr:DUF11 domain-containing protein [Methanobacterium subterraneum]